MAAKKNMPAMAVCYDFDGTLCPKNMQEYNFIPSLNIAAEKFWDEAALLARENGADPILTYMKLMLDKARSARQRITRESFTEQGAAVRLFPGVMDWFGLINDYGASRGIGVRHYIISSGIKEMIEGTELCRKKVFRAIYACSYIYDPNGVAEWPANVVNYTTKTQYLFRINKGVEDISDNDAVNDFVPEEERKIPFSRMLYIGDGSTDVPCMKLVKSQGGHSIAVYGGGDRKKKKKALALLGEGRVNFAAKADYSAGSDIFKYTTLVIDKISAAHKMFEMYSAVRKEI